MTAAPEPASHAARTAAVARVFDEVAVVYDGTGVEFFQPIAAGLVDALEPARGESVLDVGCGRGAVLLRAAVAVGPTGRVVGTDLSEAMVEACRTAVAAVGLGNADVVLDDAQAPAVAGGFDIVASSLVLFFLPDPLLALTRWLPLLVPGGRCGAATFGARDDTLRALDDLFVPWLPPALADARTSGASGPFATDEGVEDLFRSAGFASVRTVRADVRTRFADVAQWEAFSRSTGQRAMWRAVPDDEQPRLRSEAADLLAGSRHPDGGSVVTQELRYTLGVRAA